MCQCVLLWSGVVSVTSVVQVVMNVRVLEVNCSGWSRTLHMAHTFH